MNRYIYSDSVTLQEDNVFAVLEIAHFYQVMSLVQLCSAFMTSILTSDNACEVLTLAMFYNLHSLRDACCSFIDNHTTEVIQTEAFMNISADCLLYILKGDTLYGREEDILEAVEKWARHKLEGKEMNVNGKEVRKYLGESFYFLRLPTMSSQVLRESVSRKGYYSIEEYSDIAAFVSNAEDVSVTTNSSIARVPESEIINVNNQDGETRYSEYLHVSFEITMLKSAFLSRLDFGKMYPYLVNTKEIFTDEGHVQNFLGDVRHGNTFQTEFDYYKYRGKALKITTLDRPRHLNFYIKDMHKVERLKLPEELCFNLSGSVCVHDIGEQEFSAKQMNVEETQINLTKPILLEKRTAPYIVNVGMEYTSSSEFELGTMSSKNEDPIISGTKMIQIRSTSGSFAGLKNIGFKHISSRDQCE